MLLGSRLPDEGRRLEQNRFRRRGLLRIELNSRETNQRSDRAKIAVGDPGVIEDTREAVVVLSFGEARLGSTTCMPAAVIFTRRT